MRSLRLNGPGNGAFEVHELVLVLLCICLFDDLNHNRSVKMTEHLQREWRNNF